MRYRYLLYPICLLLVSCSTALSLAEGQSKFFEQRNRGWLWFEENTDREGFDKKKIAKQHKTKSQADHKRPNTKDQAPTQAEMLEAEQLNKKFSRKLELMREYIIQHPKDLGSIIRYKKQEKQMYENAMILGANWQVANLLHPEIVDELENPQNMYGRHVKKEIDITEEQQILNALSEQIEIYVFRSSSCSYCQLLEKHLNSFHLKYPNYHIEAVSIDSGKSKYFNTHHSPKMIKALKLEVMPTVIAVVKATRERFELARGAVSVRDLEEKALLLANYLANKTGTKRNPSRGLEK